MKLAIVIPVYNEEKNIPIIYRELKKVFAKINYDCEIIFVDDGSIDNSAKELDKLSIKDGKVKIIEFSRNFGKEAAITAGINSCSSDACIIIDADLQHPPKLIPEFIDRWEKGVEVVVGIRKKTKDRNFLKRVSSYLFYKIITKISETEITPNATDFRLFDKPVIQGDNAEFGPIYSQVNNPTSKFIENKILKYRDFQTNVGKKLVSLDVKYIILAKEVDWENYKFLDRQNDLKLIIETESFKVYQNLEFKNNEK